MIGFIATFLLSRRPGLAPAHAKRVAKAIVAVGAVVLAGAAFAAWLHFHDQGLVKNDRLETRAASAETSLVRDREASASAAEREDARQDRSTATQKAMTDAEAADPEAAARPAGRVSRAASDRLRARPAATEHTAS